ncbi:uncharacterized protein LOC107620150 [Arachis ipaensis]|uniref:uncharacterized protein LOC107620150 n=1 Tax=Arachis ipaensis TaxID=130454 RepID=UPI0007AFCF15|nr:uncharacterized protein LOC107620150 [Arachis ipaensis]
MNTGRKTQRRTYGCDNDVACSFLDVTQTIVRIYSPSNLQTAWISMQCFKCSSFAQRIRTEHDRMATGKPILFVKNSILS